MAVPLPVAASSRTRRLQIEVEWTGKIPRPFARTGYVDDYYFIAQWFPKLGVLEDSGWNTHQFHAATEFYADFGVYDVRITVPAAVRRRRHGPADARAWTTATAPTTHRYHDEDVHDFAWTASPDFIDLTRTFTHPTLPPVEMRLLLQPEHRGPGRALLRRHRGRAEALRRVVRRRIRTATSRSSTRPFRARPTAWSTRRSSPAAPAGWRRARVADAGDDRRARGRPSVVVRHGRHQRVRARVDGRRASTPTPPRA